MVRRSVFSAAALAMFLAFASAAFAQTFAQLSGTVTDESGGVLPGATVTVTQTGTSQSRFVVTGAKGDYVFTNLAIGPYKIAATMSGFNNFEQTGIVLNVGDARSVNIVMKLGGMSETVRVEGDATMVQTRTVSVATVVDHEQIVDLPLNGRSALQLVVLAGGAVQNNGLTDDRQPAGAVGISVAGGTANSTLYLVDGGYNNDPQSNTGNAIPFPDALQEFNAETGVRDARFGQSSGATVNAVTRSGTNNYHGNVFDFTRDHRFNSLPYFTRPENGGSGRDDGLHRDQFGGTFGGPIKKDKLFFFEGIQITNTHIVPANVTRIVPTAAVLRGDFRQMMSSACRTTPATLSAPFVNNQLDPSQWNPIARKMMTMVPVADPAFDVNGCGQYRLLQANNELDTQYVTRVDYQVTANKRIFFRDFITTNDHPAAWNNANPNLLDITSVGRGLTGSQHTIASGLDWVMTQHLVAATRFSYDHTYSLRHNNAGSPSWALLGVNVWNYTNSIDAQGRPGSSKNPGQDFINGGLWSGAFTGVFYVDTPSFTQSFDWQKGTHAYSWGVSWTRPHSDGDGTFASNGSMQFSGIFTSGTNGNANGGLNMADFVLGYASSYTGSGSQINNAWVQMPGAYVNDVWRWTRRLTLTYGLRWDPFISPKDANGFVTAFSRENFDKGIRSTVYTNAPVGLLFKGDPGFPTDGGNNKNQMNQFSPRVGFVWDPTGANKQTIRAGAGIYYDTAKLWETAHHMLNPPFGNSVQALAPTSCANVPHNPANGCPLDMNNPWSATPGGDPQAILSHQGYPVVLAPGNVAFPQNGTYVSMPVDAHPMKQYQYNVSYQWQFLPRMLLDVTYTGNMSRHVWIPGYSENPAVYIPGNCVAGQYALTAAGPCSNTTTNNTRARQILTLLNPTEGLFYGNVSQAYLDGTGHYNGLKINLTRRLSKGWSTSTNYTYSKCINQGEPGTDIGNSFATPLIDPYTNPHPDPKSNEGPCQNDRRHLFNLSSVLISPGLGHGIVRMVLKDWQLGLIVQARSGSSLTPGIQTNLSLQGGTARPFIVPGVDPYIPANQRKWVVNNGVSSLTWFNPAAFGPNSPGVNGDVPKGYLFGPGFWNADVAFSRNVNVSSHRVEIRVEAFNLFNHSNWGTPNITQGSTSLTNGNVTSTSGDPRIMQFALKYNF